MVTPNSHQTFMAFRWDLENVKTFGRLQTDKATKKEDVSWNVLDFTKKLFSSFSSYKLKTAMYAVLAQLASSTSPVRMRSLVRIQTYGLYQKWSGKSFSGFSIRTSKRVSVMLRNTDGVE